VVMGPRFREDDHLFYIDTTAPSAQKRQVRKPPDGRR
jgi:hypothetical protein